MSKALAIYQQFNQIEAAAKALQASGYFKDVTSQAQAIVKVMAGAELGLPPFAAMSGIHIIQGKPVLGANVLATLVKNDPRYNYKIVVCDNKNCELAWFEDGKQVGVSAFSWDEAKTAGLTSKDNWIKYPSDMLFARAISRGARRFAPGIFGGSPVYTPDELGVETDAEGYIDSTVRDVLPDQPLAPPAEITPPSAAMSLEQAEAVTSSDGTKYGEIATDKLANMANSIAKVLKTNGKTPEEIAEYQYKRDAIATILAIRSQVKS
jgi:hypothetical protein